MIKLYHASASLEAIFSAIAASVAELGFAQSAFKK